MITLLNFSNLLHKKSLLSKSFKKKELNHSLPFLLDVSVPGAKKIFNLCLCTPFFIDISSFFFLKKFPNQMLKKYRYFGDNSIMGNS